MNSNNEIAEGGCPDASIIIVNWNTGEYLRRCVESIINTAGDLHIEIIVVDNASTDNSLDFIESADPDARIKIIREKRNHGFSRGNNIGIASSRSRNILLLNPDTIALKDSLKKMIDFLDARASVGAAGGQLLNPDGSIQFVCGRRMITLFSQLFYFSKINLLFGKSHLADYNNLLGWDHKSTRHIPAISGAFFAIKRAAVEGVGMLDEKYFMYAEDLDYCKRIHDAGWELWFYPGSKIIHYGGRSSFQVHEEMNIQTLVSVCYFMRKHHGDLAANIYNIAIKTISFAFSILLLFPMYLLPKRKKIYAGKIERYKKILKTDLNIIR